MSLSSDVGGAVKLSGTSHPPFEKGLYLDRRLFESFVNGGKESKGSQYIFKIHEDELIVKHGHRTAVYAKAKPVAGYSELPPYKNAKTLAISESWSKLLSCAVSCATGDPVTPYLNCAYVHPVEDGVKIYSSNTTIVFVGKASAKKKPHESIAFPLGLASMLSTLEMETLVWDNKSAMISSPRGSLWQAVKVDARKNFPRKAMDRMVEEGNSSHSLFAIDCSSLSEAADRMSGYLSPVTREDKVLKMSVKAGDNKMKMSSGTGHTSFSEIVALVKPSKIDYVIDWPLEEVLPVLVFCKDQGKASIYLSDTGRTMYKTKDVCLVIARKDKKKSKKRKSK
jgi:hypothetical protein